MPNRLLHTLLTNFKAAGRLFHDILHCEELVLELNNMLNKQRYRLLGVHLALTSV